MFARTALALVLLAGCGEAEAPPEPPPVETPPTPEPEPEPEVPAEPEPEPVGPSTHDLLFLVVHDEPLLPSEERLLGVLEARVGRRRDLERRDATEEEATFLGVYLEGSEGEPGPFPATFGRARQVLVMQTAAPRVRSDGDMVSRGFVGVLLLTPPEVEPAYEQRIDEESAWRLTDDQWSGWLSGLLREAEGT